MTVNKVVTTTDSDIKVYIITDPQGKFEVDHLNHTRIYEFKRNYTSVDGIKKLKLTLSIRQQKEIYDFFTNLNGDNLMYD
tara:strand:- start:84 stop:323 length:240 start_codon:yes stop_codon:yes gene_type:complete